MLCALVLQNWIFLSQIKLNRLYLFSAFNNTDCVKAALGMGTAIIPIL